MLALRTGYIDNAENHDRAGHILSSPVVDMHRLTETLAAPHLIVVLTATLGQTGA